MLFLIFLQDGKKIIICRQIINNRNPYIILEKIHLEMLMKFFLQGEPKNDYGQIVNNQVQYQFCKISHLGVSTSDLSAG